MYANPITAHISHSRRWKRDKKAIAPNEFVYRLLRNKCVTLVCFQFGVLSWSYTRWGQQTDKTNHRFRIRFIDKGKRKRKRNWNYEYQRLLVGDLMAISGIACLSCFCSQSSCLVFLSFSPRSLWKVRRVRSGDRVACSDIWFEYLHGKETRKLVMRSLSFHSNVRAAWAFRDFAIR